ncbi:TIR domain-containing protein [Sphingomonas daechungensis]
MAEVAQLLRKERDRTDAGRDRPATLPSPVYFAFLSYSHTDSGWGEWLHDSLEKFRVPSSIAGRLTPHGIVPKRLTPIFRDRKELAASSDLGAEIREALAASRFLIVLCSPAAAKSRWTNAEIDTFKRLRPDGAVLAAIVDGEPFASDLPGRESEECLPHALRVQYDRRGRPTPRRAEPLCTDLRDDRDGKRLGLLKLVAGMLGVGLDDLVQRETVRRQRRLAILAAASLAGMVVTTSLAIFALQSRDIARDQRREAESLVGFMLGDLRTKLEPLGRLDTLDAVGARALAYYQSQDKSELSDQSLTQRSKALTLMGEIANTRGDLGRALNLYREAYASTAEALRREPDNPQRLFDHAQNVFWVGEVAHQRGLMPEAEASMREYKRLADAMVAADPDNPKWKLEVKYSTTALGALLMEQRRYPEASAILQRSLETAETLAASDPTNLDYQKGLVESLAWLADSQFSEGRLDEAIAKRERQVATIDQMILKNPADAGIRERAISAHRALGRWLGIHGSLPEALEHQRKAVAVADELLPTEPGNMDWLQWAAGAQLDYASTLLQSGRVNEAAAQTRAACDRASRLTGERSEVAEWRSLAVNCLMKRSQVSLAGGAEEEALDLANRALDAARSRRRGEPVEIALQVAQALKLIGDVRARKGDRAGAQTAWLSALQKWPKQANEPTNLALQAELLVNLGRLAEARPLRAKLQSIGYRRMVN